MNDLDSFITGKNRSMGFHFLILLLISVPVFILVKSYVNTFTRINDEEIATATTGMMMASLYGGRYLAYLFIPKGKNVPAWLLLVLPVLIFFSSFMAVVFANRLLSHREVFFMGFLGFALFVSSLSTGMLIKLVRTRIHFQLNSAELSASHSQSELSLLQSQLSPHFLFNTLNNIYGISLTQHEKVPTLLLKLSDLLRYSVYEAKAPFVPLRDELAYIKNYIDFEKIRIGNKLILSVDIEDGQGSDAIGHLKIAPMLLIVFIENAFKHSKNTRDENIFIDLDIKKWGDSVLFSIKNSTNHNADLNEFAPGNSGLGLANVYRRLELLYPNKYDLNIQENENTYSVLLRLNL